VLTTALRVFFRLRDRHPNLHAGLYVLRLIPKEVGKDPDTAQVGDTVPLGTLLELLAWRHISRNNEASHRGHDENPVR